MKKNMLVLLLAVVLLAFNGGCTSKESQNDEQAIENADVEKIETIDSIDAPPVENMDAAVTAPAPETSVTDPSLEAALTDSSAPPTNLDATITETPMADPNAPVAEDPASAAPQVSEAQLSPETNAITEMPVSAGTDSEITETPIVDATPMTEPTPVETVTRKVVAAATPMKKVEGTVPYQGKDGAWINTVYIARPKEKLVDISQKIFGTDKTKELKAIAENSYLKWRAPKAGDKIYYTSPNRPDDSTKTILYQEDMGLVPKTYVAKSGDNLRKVSKELLGFDNAWKEVWSSNAVESKTSLKDGEILRYWTNDAEVMAMAPPSPPPQGANVVDASQAPAATATMAPPPPTDMGGQPPMPPPPTDANATLPPPPTDGSAAMAATDPSVPPPPSEEPPPPPPPPVEEVAAADSNKINLDEAAAEEEEGALSSDTMMSMGALGVLVALLAFVIIRKRKQKAQMNNLEMNA